MRILVIEDEPKVARTLVKGLEADHFAVDLAGTEKKVSSWPPRLIMTESFSIGIFLNLTV